MDVYIMGVGVGTVNAVILLCGCGTNTNTYVHIIVHAQTYRATSLCSCMCIVSYMCSVRSAKYDGYGVLLLSGSLAHGGRKPWCVVLGS